MSGPESLRDWARRELTVEKKEILWEERERVAELLEISSDGSVNFRLRPEQLTELRAQEMILLYMIGKLYAEAAEYATEESVTNSELSSNLGMPTGTVKSQLKRLRDRNFVRSLEPGKHIIPPNRIREALSLIQARIA